MFYVIQVIYLFRLVRVIKMVIGAPAIGAPALSSGAHIAVLQRQGDFIDLLLKQMQTCKGYICSLFLQNDF